MSQLDEFALIRLLTGDNESARAQGNEGVAVGIGDDAAVMNLSSGCQLVASCDMMVEDVHFNSWTMGDADIGYKAMAANVSDIAAMGALPKFALVAMSIPDGYATERLQEMYKGLYECAAQFGVAIVGGDTTSSPGGLTLSVTIMGEVEQGKALRRSAAEDGDVVFITGELGCSAAGLHYLNERSGPRLEPRLTSGLEAAIITLTEAHRRPSPSVQAGRILLIQGGCHALNDVSDGLASEAWEIAEASDQGILLHEAVIPIHPHLSAYAQAIGKNPLEWILYGGEDYKLLGTIPREQVKAIQQLFQENGLPLYIVGEVSASFIGVRLKTMNGQVELIEKKGYNHFDTTESIDDIRSDEVNK